MKDEFKQNGISRRKFLNRAGLSVAGGYLLFPALKHPSQQVSAAPKSILNYREGSLNISLKVNGEKIKTKVAPDETLAEFLRERLELTGTKIVCNQGECGGCTVVLEGRAVYSCQMLAIDADGKDVVTIEGLMKGEELHPLQEAFVDEDGLQCGFCTPGQIMAAYALLLNNPKPTEEEILNGMSGNLCKCAAYPKIINSVKTAAQKGIK